MHYSIHRSFAALAGLFATQSVSAAPTLAINMNWPDPSILLVDETWYSYATADRGLHVQVASADNLEGPWDILPDAMPTLPGWVVPDNPTGSFVEAPDVVQLDDGSFVLYFAANVLNPENPPIDKGYHCVGAAKSTSPTGPFIAQDSPLACPIQSGGAIDPAGFRDRNGDSYVLYKVDGNNIGDGSYKDGCGQSSNPIPTPILLQKLNSDGMTPDGSGPIALIDRDDNDGPLIEAPSMNLANGVYYLYFSSNCYSTTKYDSSWATSNAVSSGFVKATADMGGAPLLTSNTFGLNSPGGLDVNQHGNKVAFHSDQVSGNSDVRVMYVATITESGNTVTVD